MIFFFLRSVYLLVFLHMCLSRLAPTYSDEMIREFTAIFPTIRKISTKAHETWAPSLHLRLWSRNGNLTLDQPRSLGIGSKISPPVHTCPLASWAALCLSFNTVDLVKKNAFLFEPTYIGDSLIVMIIVVMANWMWRVLRAWGGNGLLKIEPLASSFDRPRSCIRHSEASRSIIYTYTNNAHRHDTVELSLLEREREREALS